MFTFIDLFAGIGGFKLALNSNGGKCIGFSEINKDAIKTYCENHNINPNLNLGDITKITQLPQHDLLTAGVPCQSWSIAGKNLGFNDDRGQLWNDTIYLLKRTKPKAFIFENVKGLVDPRNSQALSYILTQIKNAGYFVNYFIISSQEYGVPQSRVRVYIIGFLEKKYSNLFLLPKTLKKNNTLSKIFNIKVQPQLENSMNKMMSLSSKNGFNDYFLFNDLRNGNTTIHSWDLINTTERQKKICLLLLKNRRKRQFGLLDGNPLSLKHFQSLDETIKKVELLELVKLKILKCVSYVYEIIPNEKRLTLEQVELLNLAGENLLTLDKLKIEKGGKQALNLLKQLLDAQVVKCVEERFEFKNTKISSGLNGINRIFMPRADLFPTLVASDVNDYIALKDLPSTDHEQYKKQFLKEIYFTNNYRKITKEEACQIQGFPKDFKLPPTRSRWMKLIGNSVSVPIIDVLVKAIKLTGALEN